jgi:thioredoxin 1
MYQVPVDLQNQSPTISPSDAQHLKQIVSGARIVVIKFHAEWCGPCKQTAHLFEQMSQALSSESIKFVSIDIEQDSGVGGNWGEIFRVNGVPCYMFYMDGELRSDLTQMGADLKPVEQILQQQYQLVSNTTPV